MKKTNLTSFSTNRQARKTNVHRNEGGEDSNEV